MEYLSAFRLLRRWSWPENLIGAISAGIDTDAVMDRWTAWVLTDDESPLPKEYRERDDFKHAAELYLNNSHQEYQEHKWESLIPEWDHGNDHEADTDSKQCFE